METQLPMNLNSKGNALTTQAKGRVKAGFTLWERLLRVLVQAVTLEIHRKVMPWTMG